MKRVKSYKGFIIKEPTSKEKASGLSYNYYGYKDGEEVWSTDSLWEMMEFIDCY